jgi:serine/threonine protein kinase
MSADEPTAEDEQLFALFAAGEAALASDQAAETIGDAGAPPEVRARLQRDLACAQLLRRALGRPAVDVAAAPGLPWTHLGRFEIRRELGKGGFGMVYLAYDPVLGRELALKVPRAEVAVTPELRERFGREARAAAGLEHPNIVPVYEAGEVGMVCYIASAYCPGITLGQWLKDCRDPVPFATAAELLATLAEAMEHAHRRGVVHRDLKPGNILLQSVAHQPEALARTTPSLASASGWCATDYGLPKITDFGLAKLMAETRDGDQTHSGAILGTASYMAPEQAGGKTRTAGPAADIYALGAILYEVLTGRPPFRGETYLDTLQQVQAEEPVPPTRLRPKTPRDLETICLKCLQKDPAWRYASAGALAEDLRRFVRGEPIQARRVSRAERLWRWCRRNNQLLAGASAGLVVSLVVAALLGQRSYLMEQQRQADQQTHEEERRAEKRQHALEKALNAAMSGDFDGAEQAIGEAEMLSASTGEVRLLRGQVAFHKGDTLAAIPHLEQAVKLLPESVAARALLALACAESSQTARLEQVYRGLGPMRPSTAEDYLYQGHLEALLRPDGGLDLLDEAVRLRNSVIARALRTETRASRAFYTGNIADAQAALDDAAVARGMLPDHPFVLAQTIFAQLVAAVLYEGMGRQEDRQRLLKQARPDVDKLKRFTSSPMALRVCFWYFEYVGDDAEATKMCWPDTEFPQVCTLYRRGDYPQAQQAAQRAAARGFELALVENAFVLAERDQDVVRAHAALQQAIDHPGGSRFSSACAMHGLFFLGKTRQAAQASSQIRREPGGLPMLRDDWYFSLVDYASGQISEAGLLKAAAASPLLRCNAHFLIGLRHLSDGDRPGAREHFQKCSDTRVFVCWDWIWARAFLVRLEKDSTWPRWIPPKQRETNFSAK